MKILRMIVFSLGLILFSCSPKPIIKTEVLKCDVPTIPENPKYLPVTFNLISGKYCVDLDNAKALYLNMRMMQTQNEELLSILKELKEK